MTCDGRSRQSRGASGDTPVRSGTCPRSAASAAVRGSADDPAPAGFLGRTFRPHFGWRQWLLVGLAGTLLIEAAQHLLLPGRAAELMDVVANTVGAVAGYLIASRRNIPRCAR